MKIWPFLRLLGLKLSCICAEHCSDMPNKTSIGDTVSDMVYGPHIPSAQGLLKLLQSTYEELTATKQKIIMCNFISNACQQIARSCSFIRTFTTNCLCLLIVFRMVTAICSVYGLPISKENYYGRVNSKFCCH